MPEISRFSGIVVAMFYNDREPPHFHVRHAEQRGLMEIESLALLKGQLPSKTLAVVAEWAAAHRDELWQNWSRARQQEPLARIAPPE
jgi:hypothetical protein